MTFPSINYKFNDLEEAQALTDLVEQKYAALAKYFGGHQSSACEIVFSKTAPQQNGEIYKMEAMLVIDGNSFRATATEESFEKAIDEVKSELDRELRQAK